MPTALVVQPSPGDRGEARRLQGEGFPGPGEGSTVPLQVPLVPPSPSGLGPDGVPTSSSSSGSDPERAPQRKTAKGKMAKTGD